MAEVTKALGVSRAWVYRQRREHGFPAPLAGGTRYDPAAIAAWQDRQAGLAPALAAAPTGPEDPGFDWGAELDRRIASA